MAKTAAYMRAYRLRKKQPLPAPPPLPQDDDDDQQQPQPAPQPQPQNDDDAYKITDMKQLYSQFMQADNQWADKWLEVLRKEDLDPDNRQQNTDTQKFFNEIGWAANTPEVLSESQYQQALQAAGNPTQMYHADQPYNGVGARQFAAQFMGNATDFAGNPYRQYMSGGIHGDGTYFADSASESAYYGSSQFRGFFNDKARVITESSLDSQLRRFEKQYPAFSHAISQMSAGYSYGGPDHSRDGTKSIFAAMLGYNVIKARNYYTVLDRSALTMSSQTRRANVGMNDW